MEDLVLGSITTFSKAKEWGKLAFLNLAILFMGWVFLKGIVRQAWTYIISSVIGIAICIGFIVDETAVINLARGLFSLFELG